MIKKEIRKKFLKKRLQLSTATYQHCNEQIQKLLLSTFDWKKFVAVHSYLTLFSMKEVMTDSIIDILRTINPNITIAIPKLIEGVIQNCRLDKQTILYKNQWGITEPIVDMMVDTSILNCSIIPLIAFDKKGYRVGYGKGHYDKFLQKCPKNMLKIGLCFEQPIACIEDIHHLDIKMDYCITPIAIFKFS